MTERRRCKQDVWSRERWSRKGQCQRYAVRDGYCKQHHPDSVAERDRKSQAKHDAIMNEKRYQWNGKRFFAVLKEIADGHNDPRALAQRTVSEFEDKQS